MSSTASQNLRDSAEKTMRDARDGVREMRKAANEASGDLAKDLQALRDDFSRLADQVRDILSDRGTAAWQRARSNLDDAVTGTMADARDTGREAADAAMGAMRDVSDNVVEAVDESLKNRPYTTLAVVAGLGFLFGFTWRR